MSDAFYVGSAGLTSQQRALDVIANNITNLNTYGYKRSEVRFSEVMANRMNDASPAERLLEEQRGSGVSSDVRFLISEQGELESTKNPMHVAIEGAGFLELLGPSGESYLWRGGQLDIADDGMLSARGYKLAALIGMPFDASNLRIDRDGTISTESEGEREELGQLRLVRVVDEASVERLDGGLYRVTDPRAIMDVLPGEDGGGAFVQGSLERSSVDMNTEMVRMMLTQRAYAANAQVVQAADQLMGIANNLRR